MKIPNKIRVAGHDYKVTYRDKQLSKRELVGQCHNDKKTIYLCKCYNTVRRAKSEIELTMMHEIMHAVDRHYNDNSLSEKAVTRLSNGLYQVLKDNFKF